jgi:hypothetical protein
MKRFITVVPTLKSFLELAMFPDLHRGQPVARLFKPVSPILCY